MTLLNPICINLRSRKDRKAQIKRQVKKIGLDLTFYKTNKHANPVKGCFESHLNVIKTAEKQQKEYVFILEDDAVFNYKGVVINSEEFPNDCHLIYLGGTNIKTDSELINGKFKRVKSVLSTHAYIISKRVFSLLPKDPPENMPIDVWYHTEIQKKFPCYIYDPVLTHQSDGFSDIENRHTFNDIPQTQTEYSQINYTVKENGDIILPTDPNLDLPKVSVIVPLRNNSKFSKIFTSNYLRTKYPPELIEWILVSSGKNTKFKQELPEETNGKIKFIVVENIPISTKRNIGCINSTGEIILHVDDDDIYSEFHVMSRVQVIKIQNVDCVGVTTIPCLNTETLDGFLRGDPSETLAEASLGYTRKFWEHQHFDDRVERGEGLLFLKDRQKFKVLQMPYVFVFYAVLSHQSNITKDDRKRNEIDRKLFNSLPEQIKMLV